MTREEKLERIRNCKHVFAVIEEGHFWGGQYCPAVEECILCGTTNKNELEELHYWSTYKMELTPEFQYYFHEIDSSTYRFHFLGRQVIDTKYPYLLYQSALKVGLVPYADGTDETSNIIADILTKLASVEKENNLDLNNEENLELLFYYYNISKEYKKNIK